MKLKQDLIFFEVDGYMVIVDLTSFYKKEDWYFTICPNYDTFINLQEVHFKNQSIPDYLTDFAISENLISRSPIVLRNNSHLSFWLQTTDKCNLNCSYCYIPSLHSNQRMSDDLFKLLENKLLLEKNLKSVSIKISGGEPTLVFSQWQEKVEVLKQALHSQGITLYLQLNTNLADLHKSKYQKNIVEFVKKNDVNVAVSIDGSQESNDKFRKRHINSNKIPTHLITEKEGSFNDVIHNIDLLQKNDVKASLLTTLSSSKASDILPIIEKAVAENRDFRMCDVKGGDFTSQDYIDIFNHIYDYLDNEVSKGYPLSRHMLVSDLNLHKPSSTPCSMGVSGSALYMNGDIYFCHTEFKSGKPIGSLKEDKLISEIISESNHRQQNIHDDCNKCNLRSVCASGCPIYRENGKSPMCKAHKHIIPKIYKLYFKEYIQLKQIEHEH